MSFPRRVARHDEAYVDVTREVDAILRKGSIQTMSPRVSPPAWKPRATSARCARRRAPRTRLAVGAMICARARRRFRKDRVHDVRRDRAQQDARQAGVRAEQAGQADRRRPRAARRCSTRCRCARSEAWAGSSGSARSRRSSPSPENERTSSALSPRRAAGKRAGRGSSRPAGSPRRWSPCRSRRFGSAVGHRGRGSSYARGGSRRRRTPTLGPNENAQIVVRRPNVFALAWQSVFCRRSSRVGSRS